MYACLYQWGVWLSFATWWEKDLRINMNKTPGSRDDHFLTPGTPRRKWFESVDETHYEDKQINPFAHNWYYIPDWMEEGKVAFPI
jgi:hypothetical protein